MSDHGDLAVQPTTGECHLMRLPGEIRNIIYEYALTEPDGLTYRNSEFCAARLVAHEPGDAGLNSGTRLDYVEANQLQYVSREMRRETRGLGIVYNDLTFVGTSNNLATSQFALFLRVCASRHLDYIRTITLRHRDTDLGPRPVAQDKFEDDHESANIFMDFCHKRPNATVKWHVPWMSAQRKFFLLQVFRLDLLSRPPSRPIRQLLESKWSPSLIEFMSRKHPEDEDHPLKKSPTNLIFFPQEDALDEASVWQLCQEDPDLEALVLRFVDGVEGYIPILQNLFKNGF
ncbi:hypothetical protein BU26DRAFT_553930 [Trematosphaeria pertusa]|uniref:F-box domain-containing protein n=1 Tax=Trematosphaeria pertusa TaxID=390896 RepID=A0A6A6I4E5_9PLEO|nr:uncharacterized protein BU26DRAFT_553930 [Trematosphaeria pertusa]KAF2244822.1 hypothetical protein BU26DRAFT_553930 [Trematosphaeria pertusa]